MALQFTLEISDDDVPFFVEAINRAEQRVAGRSADEIIAAAEKTFVSAQEQAMPAPVAAEIVPANDVTSHPPGCTCAVHLAWRKKAVGAG